MTISSPFTGTEPCTELPTEAFFAESPAEELSNAEKMASTVCSRCPVRDACLEYALDTRSDGIWAGTTRDERRRMNRARGYTNRQQRARAEGLETVARLFRNGLRSAAIVERTGMPSWFVYRAVTELRQQPEQVAS